MSPVNLNELGGKLNDDVDFNNLPSQGGASAPPPPPGPYRFQLPKNLSLNDFDTVKSEQHGQRIKVKFSDNAPLLIVQAHAQAEKDYLKTPFRTTLTNVPRARGREKIMVSDLDYLLKALKIVPGQGVARTNKWYVEQLIAAAAKGLDFGADVEWSWGCGDQRDAYFLTATPEQQAAPGFNLQTAETTLWEVDPNAADELKNRKGCGAKYYQGEIAKVNGEWPLKIICGGQKDGGPCGAVVRAFGNLTRFKE